ncbi:hypothetical protein EYZ11_008663 [Aspergillus tanneri]|uniref:Uncharacterized protein n=1 Tax=Aspergillus tanneri TaxID=1220188 RepID=A0A4S3J9Z5_9EURO|nr:hypothetical protein EYZ11_008663 [Aspergillus tanneri]
MDDIAEDFDYPDLSIIEGVFIWGVSTIIHSPRGGKLKVLEKAWFTLYRMSQSGIVPNTFTHSL